MQGSYRDEGAVAGRATPGQGGVSLAQERQVDDSKDRAPVADECQRYGTQRAVVGVVDRAVDRIQDPLFSARVEAVAGLLLTEETDSGGRAFQLGTDNGLDLEIDGGREVTVALGEDRADLAPALAQ